MIVKWRTDSLERVLGIYRFHVGEYEIIVIKDGMIGMLILVLVANAPEEDVLTLLQEHGLGTEFAPLSLGIVLIRMGDRLVFARQRCWYI